MRANGGGTWAKRVRENAAQTPQPAPVSVKHAATSNKNQKWVIAVWLLFGFAILSAFKEVSKLGSKAEAPKSLVTREKLSAVDETEALIDEEVDDPTLIPNERDSFANVRHHDENPHQTSKIDKEIDEGSSSEISALTQVDDEDLSAEKQTTATDEIRSKDDENQDDDEDFEVPFDIRPVFRNGCPFGWHSPSLKHPNCYHVSLVSLLADEANGRCAEMGSMHGMRSYLARVSSNEVNALLCDVLNRGNNRFLNPDRLHIGLSDGSQSGSNETLAWRDGKSFDIDDSFAPFLTRLPRKAGLLHGKSVALVCSGKNYLKWSVESDSAMPFACSGLKLKVAYSAEQENLDRRELDEDSFIYEQSDTETTTWTPVANWESHTLRSCKALMREEEEFGSLRRQHKNAMLARLETQIFWKLTEHKSRIEPKRHYLVWQSKAWFGWLDFWVEYLVKSRDFHGAPVGKFVTSSRAAKERLGYSSIFANPAVVQKFEGALVVLSRLPIPDNILAYFPPGALVNQVYTDPLARVPLGDKLELAQALIRYSQNLECREVADLDIIPPSYDASDSQGCRQAVEVMNAVRDKQEVMWIIKGPQHGGSAITIATSQDVLDRLGNCDATVLQRHELVQKLIKNPLLLDGRKFDLRVFVLIASTKPLIAYVHREPYYRATIKKFASTSTTASEKSRHVTNTHIQKVTRYNFTDKDWAEHLWTPEKIRSYAIKAGKSPNFWMESIFPKIKRALQNVFKAAAFSLTDRRPGQWKLFGVDFVIDENLNPFLLDWNAFPGWDWSYRLTWTLEYRRRILSDSWRLLLDIQRGKAIAESRPTPKAGGYELIFHTLK